MKATVLRAPRGAQLNLICTCLTSQPNLIFAIKKKSRFYYGKFQLYKTIHRVREGREWWHPVSPPHQSRFPCSSSSCVLFPVGFSFSLVQSLSHICTDFLIAWVISHRHYLLTSQPINEDLAHSLSTSLSLHLLAILVALSHKALFLTVSIMDNFFVTHSLAHNHRCFIFWGQRGRPKTSIIIKLRIVV